jgi:hypothetical protein
MQFGDKAVFLVVGRAYDDLGEKEQQRLMRRFRHKDFGIATLTEKANNLDAMRKGGEVIGRYQSGGETYVIWASGTFDATDTSPGFIAHLDDFNKDDGAIREICRKANEEVTKKLKEEASSKPQKMRKMAMQDTDMGYSKDKETVFFRTAEREYRWPTKLMPGIIEGLRQAADGVALPAGAHNLVRFIKKGDLVTDAVDINEDAVTLTAQPAIDQFTMSGGNPALASDLDNPRVMPVREALRIADALEEVLQAMWRDAGGSQ